MKKDNLKDFLQIKNSTETSAELYFYGDIVSDWWGAWQEEDQYPLAVRDFLTEHEGKELNIYINSGGGSVFAGITIYNMLKRHKGNKIVHVDGLAASIASVIALAGDKVVIPSTSMMMIHKPWMSLWGGYNSDDLKKMSEDLDNIEKVIMNVYQENLRDGVEIATIQELVNNETWLTGEEASQYFNVEVSNEESNIAACASDLFDKYNKTPKQFVNKVIPNSKPNIELVDNLIAQNEEEIEKIKLQIQLDLDKSI